MNGVISNMRLYCSLIVKRILSFYLVGSIKNKQRRERQEKGKIKKLLKTNKETLFKWSGKKIEVLI